MGYRFGKTSLSRLVGVDNKLVEVAKTAINISKQDFTIVEGLRTPERQLELYEKGMSELDGYKNISSHQLGEAIDIAPYKDGKLLWSLTNSREWLEIGRAMLRAARLHDVDIEWGIGYNIGTGYDAPHFQLK